MRNLLVAAFLVLVLSVYVEAANCGGSTACSCGDTLNLGNYTMTTPWACTGNTTGLHIASGRTLNCAGFVMDGNCGTDNYGLKFTGSGGVALNCHITGFKYGVGMLSSSSDFNHFKSTSVELASIYSNGCSGVGYGVHISTGACGNLIQDAYIHDNNDEGIHIAAACGATGNAVVESIIANNTKEEIYLLNTTGADIVANTVVGGGAFAAIYVKNSDSNDISYNTVSAGNVTFREDSDSNTFNGNILSNGTLRFEGGAGGRPDNNSMDNNDLNKSGATVYYLNNPGINNNISNSWFDGGNPDVLCENFDRPSGTNTITNPQSGESLVNDAGTGGNWCLTVN